MTPEVLVACADGSWMAEAKCRGMNTNIFYPPRGDTTGYAAAKKVCEGCPVILECRVTHASAHDGIFGGMSARERKRWRQKFKPPRRCAWCHTYTAFNTAAQRHCSQKCREASRLASKKRDLAARLQG